VYFRRPNGFTHEELFDASSDPKELEDRLEAEPEVSARLRARAEAYLEQGPKWTDTGPLELDDLQLNQLRALGYAVPN
jgi:hypothetical protein